MYPCVSRRKVLLLTAERAAPAALSRASVQLV